MAFDFLGACSVLLVYSNQKEDLDSVKQEARLFFAARMFISALAGVLLSLMYVLMSGIPLIVVAIAAGVVAVALQANVARLPIWDEE